MSPEGFSPGPEGDLEKANLQKVSLEIQNLIHAQDFDAARSLLDSLEDSGRKQQLETIFSLEKMRREKQRKEEERGATEQEKVKEGQGLTLGEHGLTREDAQYILDEVRRSQEKDFEENKKLLESLQQEKAEIDKRISERDKRIEALDKKIAEGEMAMMDFDQLEKDPVARPFLQKAALEYLKTQDREWFEREYTGELDENGYLIRKDGVANTTPAQNIGTAGMRWVENRTKQALQELSDQALLAEEEKLNAQTGSSSGAGAVTEVEQFDDSSKVLSPEEQEKPREILASAPAAELTAEASEEIVPQQSVEQFDDPRKVLTPEEVAALHAIPTRRELSQQEAHEKVGHALRNPEKAYATWDRVGSWARDNIQPSESRKHLEEEIQEILAKTAELQAAKEREDKKLVSNLASELKRHMTTFIETVKDVKGSEIVVRDIQKEEQELKDLVGRVESYEFDVKSGQFDHVEGKKSLSMEDTQEIPIPESVEEDLESTQEIPSSVVEAALAPNSPERKEVLEVLASLPEKTRAETIRGWAGVAFTAQEYKNRGLARAFHFATGLFGSEENKQKADSEKSVVRLFLDAFSKQYEDLARTSKEQREVFVKSGKGATGFATNAILTTRAGLSLFGLANPIGNIATWGALFARRGIEAVKETHFAKRSETFRMQDEGLAFEEAVRLEELASMESKKRMNELTTEDISRVYLRELPDQIMQRITGETGNYLAAEGVQQMLAKISGEINESGDQRQRDAVLKKYERKLRDLDRIVGTGATIDVVGQRLIQAGVWSKRIATVVALESLAEGAYHMGQLFGFGGHEAVSGVLAAEPVEQIEMTPEAPHPPEIILKDDFEGLGKDVTLEAPTTIEAIEPVVIEKGGNIWSAAKQIAEKTGLSQAQFAEAWTHSTVELPDGREIPIAELNLVHEGDTLSYVSGENGAVGHFEFNNASDVPYGDSLKLPGAEEIYSDDFEQQPWSDTETLPDTESTDDEERAAIARLMQDYPELTHEQAAKAVEILTREENDLPTEDVVSREVGAPVEETLQSKTSETPYSYKEPPPFAYERMTTLEDHVSAEFEKDMRAVFGGEPSVSSEWQQWKGMSVKKFMGYRFERGTPAEFLQRYTEHVMKDSHLRPLGGFFRREEPMESYIRRALFIIVSREH